MWVCGAPPRIGGKTGGRTLGGRTDTFADPASLWLATLLASSAHAAACLRASELQCMMLVLCGMMTCTYVCMTFKIIREHRTHGKRRGEGSRAIGVEKRGEEGGMRGKGWMREERGGGGGGVILIPQHVAQERMNDHC